MTVSSRWIRYLGRSYAMPSGSSSTCSPISVNARTMPHWPRWHVPKCHGSQKAGDTSCGPTSRTSAATVPRVPRGDIEVKRRAQCGKSHTTISLQAAWRTRILVVESVRDCDAENNPRSASRSECSSPQFTVPSHSGWVQPMPSHTRRLTTCNTINRKNWPIPLAYGTTSRLT